MIPTGNANLAEMLLVRELLVLIRSTTNNTTETIQATEN
jgi:hypothetical protein